jgi:hypothetical protein
MIFKLKTEETFMRQLALIVGFCLLMNLSVYGHSECFFKKPILVIKGPTGPTGPKGSKGATGAAGATGVRGQAGAKGASGARGPIGLQGPRGVKGAKGAKGAKGSKGARGRSGAEGERGRTGPTGPSGGAVSYLSLQGEPLLDFVDDEPAHFNQINARAGAIEPIPVATDPDNPDYTSVILPVAGDYSISFSITFLNTSSDDFEAKVALLETESESEILNRSATVPTSASSGSTTIASEIIYRATERTAISLSMCSFDPVDGISYQSPVLVVKQLSP